MQSEITQTKQEGLWYLRERLPSWRWSAIRPRPVLFVAWVAIALFGAISESFNSKPDAPFAALLLYWLVVTVLRASAEWLVRASLRREFDLPVVLSVVVEPIFVAMILAPLLIVAGMLAQTMEPAQMLVMLARAYLLSLFISACEVMIRAASCRDEDKCAPPPPRHVVVGYYNERRIRDHL